MRLERGVVRVRWRCRQERKEARKSSSLLHLSRYLVAVPTHAEAVVVGVVVGVVVVAAWVEHIAAVGTVAAEAQLQDSVAAVVVVAVVAAVVGLLLEVQGAASCCDGEAGGCGFGSPRS